MDTFKQHNEAWKKTHVIMADKDISSDAPIWKLADVPIMEDRLMPIPITDPIHHAG